MEPIFIALGFLGLILLVFVTDLAFSFLIMFCLCVSYFIESRIKGIKWIDSFYGSASVVLIIVGLIVACFGCFLLPQTPEKIADNSTILQNSSSNSSQFAFTNSSFIQNISLNESISTYSQNTVNTSNLNENVTNSDTEQNNKSNPILEALGLGFGVIGFGIALFAFGLGNITAIQSKYEFQELKTHVIDGPYFAQRFKKNLTPMDCLKIFGFWAPLGFFIVFTNLLTPQSTYLILIRILIGLIPLIIGIIAIYYGLSRHERNCSDTIQTVFAQLRSR